MFKKKNQAIPSQSKKSDIYNIETITFNSLKKFSQNSLSNNTVFFDSSSKI